MQFIYVVVLLWVTTVLPKRERDGTRRGKLRNVVHAALISELTPTEDDEFYHRTPSEDCKSVT